MKLGEGCTSKCHKQKRKIDCENGLFENCGGIFTDVVVVDCTTTQTKRSPSKTIIIIHTNLLAFTQTA